MSKKEVKRVELEEVRETIRLAIIEQFGQSVRQFCTSGTPQEWGILDDPHHLEVYLSTNGTVSYRVFRALYAGLGLGVLEQKTRRVVTTTYFHTPKS